jgi:hypothetical protein
MRFSLRTVGYLLLGAVSAFLLLQVACVAGFNKWQRVLFVLVTGGVGIVVLTRERGEPFNRPFILLLSMMMGLIFAGVFVPHPYNYLVGVAGMVGFYGGVHVVNKLARAEAQAVPSD